MSLQGKAALVADATRGAGRGIGAAEATAYVSGRTTRHQQSEYARPEENPCRDCLSDPVILLRQQVHGHGDANLSEFSGDCPADGFIVILELFEQSRIT